MQPSRVPEGTPRKLRARGPAVKQKFTRHERLLAGVPFLPVQASEQRVLEVLLICANDFGESWLKPRTIARNTPRSSHARRLAEFEQDGEVTHYSTTQARKVLRRLKKRGWIDWRWIRPGGYFPSANGTGRGRYTKTGGRVFRVLGEVLGAAMGIEFISARSALQRDDWSDPQSAGVSGPKPTPETKGSIDPGGSPVDRSWEEHPSGSLNLKSGSPARPPAAPARAMPANEAKRSRAAAPPPLSHHGPPERPKSESESKGGEKEQGSDRVELARLVAIGEALSRGDIATALRLNGERHSQRVDTCTDAPIAASPGDTNAAPRTPTCKPGEV
jgi:hypothetical protein